jgi:hypothetical protein
VYVYHRVCIPPCRVCISSCMYTTVYVYHRVCIIGFCWCRIEHLEMGDGWIQVSQRRLVVTSPQFTTKYGLERTMGMMLSLAQISFENIRYWLEVGLDILFETWETGNPKIIPKYGYWKWRHVLEMGIRWDRFFNGVVWWPHHRLPPNTVWRGPWGWCYPLPK